MAVRAIGKAVECFKRDKTTLSVVQAPVGDLLRQPHPGVQGAGQGEPLDAGRPDDLPLIYGEYQGERFDRMKGQVDLVYRDGKFYLYATVEMPEYAPIKPTEFLGVDLGIVNIAADSDGTVHSGEAVEKIRRKHQTSRKTRQRKGTKGAKKRLKKLAGKEARFRKQENHRISKTIVAVAKGTGRGIALEDLKGIRDRTTVGRRQRNRHSGWSFFQLRSFVEYKAKLCRRARDRGRPSQHQPDVLRLRALREGQPQDSSGVRSVQALRILRERRSQRSPQPCGLGPK